VRRYLFDALGGDAVLEGGLEIETTLDARLQHAAVESVRRGLEALAERQGYRGAERPWDAELAAALARPKGTRSRRRRGRGRAPPPERPLRGVVRRRRGSADARVAFATGVEAGSRSPTWRGRGRPTRRRVRRRRSRSRVFPR
jgi:membrane peptidoglycan carboxypeptidase